MGTGNRGQQNHKKAHKSGVHPNTFSQLNLTDPERESMCKHIPPETYDASKVLALLNKGKEDKAGYSYTQGRDIDRVEFGRKKLIIKKED